MAGASAAKANPNGHGGARPGAGRKPKSDGGDGDPYVMLARAKAKHEIYRANTAELDYRKRAGELLERADVEVAATRLHAFLAQSLRSLPDDLERRCALTPEQALEVSRYVDALTADLEERINGF